MIACDLSIPSNIGGSKPAWRTRPGNWEFGKLRWENTPGVCGKISRHGWWNMTVLCIDVTCLWLVVYSQMIFNLSKWCSKVFCLWSIHEYTHFNLYIYIFIYIWVSMVSIMCFTTVHICNIVLHVFWAPNCLFVQHFYRFGLSTWLEFY